MTPKPPPSPERFAIVLRAEPGPVPAVVRLRQALKYCRRAQGLRCMAIETAPVAVDPDRDDREPKKSQKRAKVSQSEP